MKIRFWGVRGSVPVSGLPFIHTGGNTSCVELVHDGERLVLDGGTGLRALGAELGVRAHKVHLLFSHVHWDHIQGVPFFLPALHPGAHLTFHGAERASGTLRDALARQMRPPQFPLSLDQLPARLEFCSFRGNQPFEVGPFRVVPLDLNHPDGVCAYRVEAGGKAVVYATDNEHGDRLDPRLVALSAGADLLVHDAQYHESEYRGEVGPSRRGWGHSTWEQAVAVARSAAAQRLALFHHDPVRTDQAVSGIEHQAAQRFTGAFAAREGLTVAL